MGSNLEDGGNFKPDVVDYPDESDYAENYEDEGGGNVGGIHEGGDRDCGGGGTGDSIHEKRDNLISTFVKIWSLSFSGGSKLDEAVKEFCIKAGFGSPQEPKVKLKGTRSETNFEPIGTY